MLLITTTEHGTTEWPTSATLGDFLGFRKVPHRCTDGMFHCSTHPPNIQQVTNAGAEPRYKAKYASQQGTKALSALSQYNKKSNLKSNKSDKGVWSSVKGAQVRGTMAVICDLLRDNPAHPAKIDFLLEAIIVTKVTF